MVGKYEAYQSRGVKQEVMAWNAEQKAHAEEVRANQERETRLLVERQKIAEDAFVKADTDGSGSVSREELLDLLMLIQEQEHREYGTKPPERSDVEEWLVGEFDKADTDKNGEIDFDEVRHACALLCADGCATCCAALSCTFDLRFGSHASVHRSVCRLL